MQLIEEKRGEMLEENIKNVECLFFFFFGSYSVNCCVNAALPVTFFTENASRVK
jgi:hypothetical protein